MSALAMILTAAMTVPGDGPEKASSEVAYSPEPLNLRGEWKLILQVKDKESEPKTEMTIKNGWMEARSPQGRVGSHVKMLFNQGGKVRFRWMTGAYHGIYQQQGDRLMLCLRKYDDDDKGGEGYPTSFRASADQALIIFHRVKPHK